MGRLALPTLLSILALAPPILGAANIEITPFAAYRFGGEIEADDNALFSMDVDVDESDAFGVLLGIPVNPGLQIELLYSEQQTELVANDNLFAPQVGLTDVDVTYFHVGVTWQWHFDRVQPFVAGGLGIGRVDPGVPGTDDDRFSMNFGGGVKIMTSPHVGVRFEGRTYWTNTSDDDYWDDWDDYNGWNDLVQGEVKVGLVLAF